MTRESFTLGIKDTYHNIKDGMLDAMEKELNGYSENDIGLIYDAVLRESKFTPNVHSVCDAIKIIGISRNNNKKFVYKCDDCQTMYAQVNDPLSAYRCPLCGSHERSMAEYNNGDPVIVMQSACLVSAKGSVNCELFDKYQKDKRAIGIYGTTCKDYTEMNKKECQTCLCKDCCQNERKQIRARQNEITKRAVNKNKL